MDVSATQVLSVMLTVFYYLLLPFLKLIQLLILALKPFLHTLNFILLPIIHLFQFVLQLILFPFIRFRGLELVEVRLMPSVTASATALLLTLLTSIA